MKLLHQAAFLLVIVGALNWGLVGLLNLNLVEAVLGSVGLDRLVYVLVGVSAVYIGATHMTTCTYCAKGAKK